MQGARPTVRYVSLILSVLFGGIAVMGGCDTMPGTDSDSATPDVVWTYDLKHDEVDDTQPLLLDGVAYVAADHFLFAFDAESGERLWRSRELTSQGSFFSEQVLHDNGRLFLKDVNIFRAFDRSSGEVLWSMFIPNFEPGDDFLTQTEDDLYAGGHQELAQVDKENGAIVNRFNVGTDLPDSISHGVNQPILGPEGLLYLPTGFFREEVGATEGRMHAFDPTTGTIEWTFKPEARWLSAGDDSVLTDTAIHGGDLASDFIVFPAGQSIIALDRRTGKEQWEQFYPDDGFDFDLTIKNGVVYVGSLGENVYALDLQTGEELWRTKTRGSISTILTIRDGTVYFCNGSGGEIWVLDADTGEVLWHSFPPEFSNDRSFTYLSPLGVGEDYMVDVGSQKIYGLTRP